MSEPEAVTYLGDSVYVSKHPLGIELTTQNGYGPTNRIVLEPEVYASLVVFVQRMALAEEDREN